MRKEKLHLGVVLAGAVTAGAFTAGVIDYLVNTLRNWEKEYEKDPNNVPKPNVVLDVLTGASAGSIAAAVTTLGLGTNNLPFVEDVHSPDASKNILFDTWVNLGLKPEEDVLDTLLSLDDIAEDESELRSMLNTSFIERMVETLIKRVKESEVIDLPNYVNPDLEILMTLSNLRGLPIDLRFSGSDKFGHSMTYHKAYALFQYGKENDNGEHDKLNFNVKNHEDLITFLTCARASGAFPIGLQSVPIKRIKNEYIRSNIKRIFGDKSNISPRLSEEKDYEFVAIDGGMTNNEPLAEALKSLKKINKIIVISPQKASSVLVDLPKNVDTKSLDEYFSDVIVPNNSYEFIHLTDYNNSDELMKVLNAIKPNDDNYKVLLVSHNLGKIDIDALNKSDDSLGTLHNLLLKNKAYEVIHLNGDKANTNLMSDLIKSIKEDKDLYKMVLVDPFPSYFSSKIKKYDVNQSSVFDIIIPLYHTLRNQAIFKESDIVDLFKDDAQKHMIWPTRYEYEKNESNEIVRVSKSNAIACGSLGGFGGFLDREFRVHDYQLGQKNAQNFIRYYFNREIKETDNFSPEYIEKFGVKDEDGHLRVPNIPDYSIQGRKKVLGKDAFVPAIESAMMDFPKANVDELIKKIEPKLKKRSKKVIDITFKKFVTNNGNSTTGFKILGTLFMSLLGKRLLSKTITKRVVRTIVDELDKYELTDKKF